jgi:hypothetical protein
MGSTRQSLLQLLDAFGRQQRCWSEGIYTVRARCNQPLFCFGEYFEGQLVNTCRD